MLVYINYNVCARAHLLLDEVCYVCGRRCICVCVSCIIRKENWGLGVVKEAKSVFACPLCDDADGDDDD